MFWEALGVLPTIHSIAQSNGTNWLLECRNLDIPLFKLSISWKSIFSFLIWNIWLTRNHNKYNQSNISILLDISFDRVAEFIFLTDSPRPSKPHGYKTWTPTQHGLKLNFNGPFKYSTKAGGVGEYSET